MYTSQNQENFTMKVTVQKIQTCRPALKLQLREASHKFRNPHLVTKLVLPRKLTFSPTIATLLSYSWLSFSAMALGMNRLLCRFLVPEWQRCFGDAKISSWVFCYSLGWLPVPFASWQAKLEANCFFTLDRWIKGRAPVVASWLRILFAVCVVRF